MTNKWHHHLIALTLMSVWLLHFNTLIATRTIYTKTNHEYNVRVKADDAVNYWCSIPSSNETTSTVLVHTKYGMVFLFTVSQEQSISSTPDVMIQIPVVGVTHKSAVNGTSVLYTPIYHELGTINWAVTDLVTFTLNKYATKLPSDIVWNGEAAETFIMSHYLLFKCFDARNRLVVCLINTMDNFKLVDHFVADAMEWNRIQVISNSQFIIARTDYLVVHLYSVSQNGIMKENVTYTSDFKPGGVQISKDYITWKYSHLLYFMPTNNISVSSVEVIDGLLVQAALYAVTGSDIIYKNDGKVVNRYSLTQRRIVDEYEGKFTNNIINAVLQILTELDMGSFTLLMRGRQVAQYNINVQTQIHTVSSFANIGDSLYTVTNSGIYFHSLYRTYLTMSQVIWWNSIPRMACSLTSMQSNKYKQ
jgi:hypothetical protein